MGRTFQTLLALSLFAALLLSSMGIVLKERATTDDSEVLRKVIEITAKNEKEELLNAFGLQAEVLQSNIPSRPIWNYVLAVTYGYSYCSINQCQRQLPVPLPNLLGIHGLWPNSYVRYPLFPRETMTSCPPDVPFTPADLQPIQPTLKSTWPNYRRYGILAGFQLFWERQWDRHGTCTFYNVLEYFSETIRLFSNLNLQPIFTSPDIYPSNTHPYTVQYVIQTLRNYGLKQPYLRCARSSRTNQMILLELEFCLDPRLAAFQDCSPTYYTQIADTGCYINTGFLIPENTL